jgi:inositol oxygenase
MRNYTGPNTVDSVANTYELNHVGQTVSLVNEMTTRYCEFDRVSMTIWQAMDLLNDFFDKSDPDFSHSQLAHAFLTAEDLRKRFPEEDWLHLCGLLHDMGKVLSLPLFGSLPQWMVVGDTFPVGCLHSKEIVHYEYFKDNKDTLDSRYNTEYGIYEPHCGLDKLKMSWGHDEYLYQLLVKNKCTFPRNGLNVIRYHSFYPWHLKGEYKHLMKSPEDDETLIWVKRFNMSDLYSKSHVILEKDDIENNLKPYYQKLIEKYFPDPVLRF